MQYIDQNNGPFHKWPFFRTHEIEQTAVKDLRAHNLFPAKPAEVNLDSLVQDLFHFTPEYGQPGSGMLGRICFSPDRIEKIILAESLADLSAGPTIEHRRRSTLAHEIGHGRLHRAQFTALAKARQNGCPNHLVRYPKAAPLHANFSGNIREQDMAPVGPTDTWERMSEWQANRYMAALLTPESLVRMAARDFLEVRRGDGAINVTDAQRRALATEVSAIRPDPPRHPFPRDRIAGLSPFQRHALHPVPTGGADVLKSGRES